MAPKSLVLLHPEARRRTADPRRPMVRHAQRRAPQAHTQRLEERARRYSQLADSGDALPPHDALSTPAALAVAERSDERIVCQTFDFHDVP